MPGAAQIVLAVHDEQVLVTQLLELDRGADTPETGTHDEDVELLAAHGRVGYPTHVSATKSLVPQGFCAESSVIGSLSESVS